MAENKFGEEVLNVAGKYAPADKEFAEKNKQNMSAVADDANDLIAKQGEYNYKALNENVKKYQESIKKIDDGLKENFPKGVIRAYKDGAFGEKGSKDAKRTMGNAIMGILADTLGNLGNAAGSVVGKSPAYEGGANWFNDMQMGNLKQGLENKWAKDKASTEGAIDMARKNGTSLTDAQDTVAAFTSNAVLQSQFNRMDLSDKNYVIQVNEEAGHILSEFSNPEMLSYIQGMAANGASPKECAVIAIAKFAPEFLGKYVSENGLPDGMTLEGLQGAFGNSESKAAKQEAKTLSNGENIDTGLVGQKKDFERLNNQATQLEQAFYDTGDEESFLKDYQKIYDEWSKHGFANNFRSFKTPQEQLAFMKQRKSDYTAATEKKTEAEKKATEAKTKQQTATTNQQKRQAKKEERQANKEAKQAEKKIQQMNKGK